MSRPAIIYLGADHAGFALKKRVKHYLESVEVEVENWKNNTAHFVHDHDLKTVYIRRPPPV